MFTIEKNIPLVDKSNLALKLEQIPLDKMEIGDSVLIPFSFIKYPTAILKFLRQKGIKSNFTTKKEETGTRIYKIK